MEVSRAAAALSREAFRQHAHDRIELFTLEVAIRIRATGQREQVIFSPLFSSDSGDDLLREDIERTFRDFELIQFAPPHRVNDRGALDQFIARKRNILPFGKPATVWLERPTRWRKLAIERVEPSWQTRFTSPMSMPNSNDAVATSALSSPALSRCSAERRCSRARLP